MGLDGRYERLERRTGGQVVSLLGARKSIGTGIDAGLADKPIARLERSARGGLRLIVDGGHDELRISLPTGEEHRVLERLRHDLDSLLREGAA